MHLEQTLTFSNYDNLKICSYAKHFLLHIDSEDFSLETTWIKSKHFKQTILHQQLVSFIYIINLSLYLNLEEIYFAVNDTGNFSVDICLLGALIIYTRGCWWRIWQSQVWINFTSASIHYWINLEVKNMITLLINSYSDMLNIFSSMLYKRISKLSFGIYWGRRIILPIVRDINEITEILR